MGLLQELATMGFYILTAWQCTTAARSAVVIATTGVAPASYSVDSARNQPIVEIGCSETKSRTPTATIRFHMYSADLDSTSLDVTVYKDGFKSNRFASIGLKRGAKQATIQIPKLLRDLGPYTF